MTIKLIVFAVLLFPFSKISSQQNIWEPTAGNFGGTVNALAVNQNDVLFVYMGGGLFKSSDNGDSWININNGLQGLYVTSIVFNSAGEIFIGTGNGGGIFKSTDEGETWVHLNDPLINFTVKGLDINSSNHLFAAISNRGIYRSMDNGNSWEEVNIGLTNFIFNSMFISKLGSIKDFIFISVGALGDIRAVFRTTDNGNNWEHMNLSLSWQFAMTFTSNSLGEVYVGIQSQWHHTYGGVLKSTDGGYNWLGAGYSSQIVILILDRNEFIYTGTYDWFGGGLIVRTTNNGANWQNFSSGLPNYWIETLVCNSQGILFTAINFEGIFRTIQTTTDVEEYYENVPNEFNLSQNYPNPFNPSTRIQYAVSSRLFVSLKVYDVLGNEIATLVNDEKAAGSYAVEFDATGLPSGIYFYKLQVGSFVETKKMILLR
ncbi:MAG: T9SS type A sorting domain-containing protein [Ignavibacteria bacterium]|nr:T9SS type A sorting domain-containing protein [Ignavibacteria bacterium]